MHIVTQIRRASDLNLRIIREIDRTVSGIDRSQGKIDKTLTDENKMALI